MEWARPCGTASISSRWRFGIWSGKGRGAESERRNVEFVMKRDSRVGAAAAVNSRNEVEVMYEWNQ
jgi:hypothetical protein